MLLDIFIGMSYTPDHVDNTVQLYWGKIGFHQVMQTLLLGMQPEQKPSGRWSSNKPCYIKRNSNGFLFHQCKTTGLWFGLSSGSDSGSSYLDHLICFPQADMCFYAIRLVICNHGGLL